MTPEEKAVIQAAIRWQRADSRDAVEDAADALQDAIMALDKERFESFVSGVAARQWDPEYPGCAPETCGGTRYDPCSTVMRTQGARHDGVCVAEHAPDAPCEWCCLNCASLAASVTRVDGTEAGEPTRDCVHGPKWLPATFSQCLTGDRMRVAGQETDVLWVSSGEWHVDNSDKWHPKRWDHTELRMDLSANPGRQVYPPETVCEILCSPEREATLIVQQTFPGSFRVVDIPVADGVE